MDFGLSIKVVVITGADGGIGKAIAQAFVAEGAFVAAIGHERDRIEKTARKLAGDGGTVEPFAADLTHAAAVDEMAKAVLQRFGTVHVLVNAAGGVAKFAPFDEFADEEWSKSLSVHNSTPGRRVAALRALPNEWHWAATRALQPSL